MSRVALSAVFAVAGAAKLLDLRGSREAMEGFGVPRSTARVLGTLLPPAELAVAVLLLPARTAWWGALAALALLLSFLAAMGRSLAAGEAPDCHCFGTLHSAPVGRATLLRTLSLSVVAAFMVAQGPGQVGATATAWIGRLHGSSALAAAGLLGSVIVAFVGAWVVIELLRAHGRLLARVDTLESALAGAGIPIPAQPGVGTNGHADAPGLPVGVPAPDFALDDLDGARVSLADLLAPGLPVLIVFTDPGCGPCRELFPYLAEWQREYSGRVTVAVVGEGDSEGLKAKREELDLQNVLVQEDRTVAGAYRSYGTPTGVLVSKDGTIASALATGPSRVRQTLAQALGEEPRIIVHEVGGDGVRPASTMEVPRPGAEAPDFELPLLAGGTVSSAGLRGTETVLLFWNPGCGFCQGMAGRLAAWLRDSPADAPTLLFVSRGNAEDHHVLGEDAAVAIDEDFRVGSLYGASGTPMAVLIDADGRIASTVTAGADAVMALLKYDGVPELAHG